MKVILAILPVLAAALGLLPDLPKNRPAMSPDYQETVKAGTKAGQRYLENGPFETAEFEQTAMQNFSKHEVYYPKAVPDYSQDLPDRLPAAGMAGS